MVGGKLKMYRKRNLKSKAAVRRGWENESFGQRGGSEVGRSEVIGERKRGGRETPVRR